MGERKKVRVNATTILFAMASSSLLPTTNPHPLNSTTATIPPPYPQSARLGAAGSVARYQPPPDWSPTHRFSPNSAAWALPLVLFLIIIEPSLPLPHWIHPPQPELHTPSPSHASTRLSLSFATHPLLNPPTLVLALTPGPSCHRSSSSLSRRALPLPLLARRYRCSVHVQLSSSLPFFMRNHRSLPLHTGDAGTTVPSLCVCTVTASPNIEIGLGANEWIWLNVIKGILIRLTSKWIFFPFLEWSPNIIEKVGLDGNFDFEKGVKWAN